MRKKRILSCFLLQYWPETKVENDRVAAKYKTYKMCTNLIVVQRVLRRRHVGGRVRGRELPRERIDRIGGRRHRSRGEYMLVANAVAEVGRHGGRGHLRAATIRMRPDRWCPDRWERRCCLHHRRLGVHRTRARVMVLALPQLAANKANRDHGPIAPDHLPALSIQPRELACLRDRVLGTRKLLGSEILWALQGTKVPEAQSKSLFDETLKSEKDQRFKISRIYEVPEILRDSGFERKKEKTKRELLGHPDSLSSDVPRARSYASRHGSVECDDVRSIRIVKDSDYISRRSGFPSNDSRGNPKVFEEKMNVNVFPFLSLYDLFLSHAFTLHGAVVKSAVFLHMWRNPISPLVSLPLFILFNAIVTRLNRNSGILYDLSLRCSCIDASFLQRRMWTIIPKSFYVCVSFSLSLSY